MFAWFITVVAMDEIAPGALHWTAFHERIRSDVSSYYLPAAGTLIDPMVPPDGIEAVAAHGRPERIVLTNRHHLRHSEQFVDAFGCTTLCHEAGLHEFRDGPAVEGFRFGDELAPGIEALEVDAICPEETALHIAAGEGMLAFADGIVRWGDGPLTFVPDGLLGEDPERVKTGLRRAYRRLLDRDFDTLLFAHGPPVARDGRAVLERFLA
jgi:glyoxylase-like metal-dependent hydrolase (beta-lactamase superfamily II)